MCGGVSGCVSVCARPSRAVFRCSFYSEFRHFFQLAIDSEVIAKKEIAVTVASFLFRLFLGDWPSHPFGYPNSSLRTG